MQFLPRMHLWLIGAALLAARAGVAAEPRQAAQRIDLEIQAQLDAKGLRAAGRADDAEFLRRLSLDLHGVIPPADRVAAYLDDPDPNKREKLIDGMLADPQYGEYQADLWFRLLVPAPDRETPYHFFRNWLVKSFNANQPWDKMVYEMMTATAESKAAIAANPAVGWMLVAKNRALDLQEAADLVGLAFMGMRLNCAQCHNHPLMDLKRKEYWGMAAFFANVARRPGYGLIERKDPKRQLPEGGLAMPARFLTGEEPKLDPDAPLRPVFARWLTTPDNPYFARALVNRVWGNLFGRGIVHPLDNMHAENPPSHPELLKYLTQEFVASGHDLKHLVRSICLSATYQRSSQPAAAVRPQDRPGPEWLSYRPARVLTPWQLYDSLVRLDQVPPRPAWPGYEKGFQSFLSLFDTDGEPDPLAYERGIPQVLRLMNATRSAALLDRITAADKDPARVLERMYLAILSRRPSPQESARMQAHVARAGSDPRIGCEDVIWVLLQTSEFTLNH